MALQEDRESLLRIVRRFEGEAANEETLTLAWSLRQRSRFRTRLDGGPEVGVFLSRGEVLRDGDRLLADDGRCVRVVAACEDVAVARSHDARELARACYHLGNRHVPLQIADGCVRFQPDHVLEDMLRVLGLTVGRETSPFQPEPGAYGQAGHSHPHDHAHEPSHD